MSQVHFSPVTKLSRFFSICFWISCFFFQRGPWPELVSTRRFSSTNPPHAEPCLHSSILNAPCGLPQVYRNMRSGQSGFPWPGRSSNSPRSIASFMIAWTILSNDIIPLLRRSLLRDLHFHKRDASPFEEFPNLHRGMPSG
jgi:hypothetical protein